MADERTGRGGGTPGRWMLLALGAVVAQAQEPASEPQLRLTGTEHVLYSRAFVFQPDHPWHSSNSVRGLYYFGQLEVEENRGTAGGELTFEVEEVTGGAAHRYCPRVDACKDLQLGVRPRTGQMYLHLDTPGREDARLPVSDFESQRAEVSVEDASIGLKVYREIVVEPPVNRPDCGGYPRDDVDRFTCLFLHEELPQGRREVPEPVRSVLPELVQPRENYRLVFTEEFDGSEVDRSQGCENRLAGLDPDVWTYGPNACANVDADNVPCMNIEDGHLFLAKTSVCSGQTTTAGKFSYRYGYAETRVTVKLAYPGFWVNHAMAQWAGGVYAPFRYIHGLYGVEVRDYESAGKYLGAELDVFEFILGAGKGSLNMHQYVNAFTRVKRPGVPPKRGDRIVDICHGRGGTMRIDPPGLCRDGAELTATIGLEWTPKGYLSWLKIEGVHDDFVLLDKRVTNLRHKRWNPIRRAFGSYWLPVDLAGRREAYSTWTVGNRSLEVQGYAVGHVPADIGMAAWGYPEASDTSIGTWMKIDYIRVFQPVNGYRDMEPVYN